VKQLEIVMFAVSVKIRVNIEWWVMVVFLWKSDDCGDLLKWIVSVYGLVL
jgi:hypothetical protein